MHASLHSGALLGASAAPVEVQVDLSLGLPGFFLVGLPDSACVEAKVRCLTAIRNGGLSLPQKRITVNLAPADLRKEGAGFDLPIALGVLCASGLLTPGALLGVWAVGELSLVGELLQSRGVLPIALAARKAGARLLLVPQSNAAEGALVDGLAVVGAASLTEACMVLSGEVPLRPALRAPFRPAPDAEAAALDFAEVRGQLSGKRALEVAAAGGHNALLVGPPGSGKTMLATRLPGILPELTFDEAVETTSVWSVAARLKPGQGLVAERPFRAPHHTISVAGLIGGGSPPRPGEISLAHRGVLWLDELPEFRRAALEALRQPLEEGSVSIVRLRGSVSLPARFMLLAAMNPCPCGHAADADPHRCRCSQAARAAYRRRVSGPILDRFDLHVDVPALAPREMSAEEPCETSAQIRARVVAAREAQRRRYRHLPSVHANAQLRGRHLRDLCGATSEAREVLATSMEKLQLSARAHDRVLKVARTIADLGGAPRVESDHVLEALQYRSLDRTQGFLELFRLDAPSQDPPGDLPGAQPSFQEGP